jgi:O-antigen/teichoic acid export membrane protein
MELRKIVKSTSYLLSSKVIQFLASIVKAKLGAVLLGTTGMGIYNQVNNLSSMLSQLALFSMNDGLVKQIAENRGQKNFTEILKGLARSYAVLIIFSILIATTLCLVFARPLTLFFLGDYKYLTFYLYGVAGIPILIINSLSFALLKSMKATKEISRANIIGSVYSLLLYIPLVYYLKIAGAAISIAVNSAILLLINNVQARKIIRRNADLTFRELLSGRADRKYTGELLYFAFYGATTGLIYIGAESVCRAIVVNKIGVDMLGLYSPVTAWSGLLTGFIVPAIQIYLFPRISECKGNEEISGIVNDYFFLITFLMIPFLFISISFRDVLIKIFYSGDFLDAGRYLPWHFIGLLFFMWWNILAMVLTPTGRIKTHGFFIILMSAANILIVYALVPRAGLYGWMMKFILSPVIFSSIYFLYLRKAVSLKVLPRNILIMIYAFIGSLILIAFDKYQLKYFLSFIFSGFGILFIRKNEWAVVKDKFREQFSG